MNEIKEKKDDITAKSNDENEKYLNLIFLEFLTTC